MLEIIFLLLIVYFFLFLISIFLQDNSYADVFWGIGFLLVTGYTFLARENFFFHQIVLSFLVTLWGFRISLYILSKKIKTHGEDFRYKQWRDTWKYFYVRSFFQIYILQGILLFIISLPIIFVNQDLRPSPSIFFTVIGALIALAGLIFETTADLQLSKFMKIKKPWEIFTKGLYAYSRHPNYFWESVFWLGISVIAFPVHPFSFISFFTITYLLLYVSGVPMLEKKYEGNKAFEEYKKKVNMFVPWFKINS